MNEKGCFIVENQGLSRSSAIFQVKFLNEWHVVMISVLTQLVQIMKPIQAAESCSVLWGGKNQTLTLRQRFETKHQTHVPAVVLEKKDF